MFLQLYQLFLLFLTCLHIRYQVSGVGSPAMATIEFIKIPIFVLLAIDYAAIMCMTFYSAMNFFLFPFPAFVIPLTYLVYWYVIVRFTYAWSTSNAQALRQLVSRPFGIISTNGLLAVMITATIHLIYFNYSLGYFIATFNFNEYPSKSHPFSSKSSIQWWLGMSYTFLIIHDLCTVALLMVSYIYWINLVAFLKKDQPPIKGESKESNHFQQPILFYPPQQEYGGSPTDRYHDQLQFNGYTHPLHAQPQPQIIQKVIILPPRPVMISINSPSLPPRSDAYAMVSRSNYPPPLPQRSEVTSVVSISFTSPQLPPRPMR